MPMNWYLTEPSSASLRSFLMWDAREQHFIHLMGKLERNCTQVTCGRNKADQLFVRAFPAETDVLLAARP